MYISYAMINQRNSLDKSLEEIQNILLLLPDKLNYLQEL